jgi:LytS/YehU family sensor histidine kinase
MEAGDMLSLAIVLALFIAATLGAEAAPKAKSKKKANTETIVQVITVSGECTKLVQTWHPVEGCKSILMNINYSTGVSAYWFATGETVLSFSGDGAHRVEQGSNIVVQSIERVILAATTDVSKEEDAQVEAAVGFCRFGDPTVKGSTVECVAHTRAGLYEGSFAPDGNPPELKVFQIEQ